MTSLATAADELYAAPVAEFMATRSRLVAEARAENDRVLAGQIGKLRKPSVAAAVINSLVRLRPDLTEQLVSVGEQLRAAQAIGHGTALTALRPARDALLTDWVAAAGGAARAADGVLSAAAGEEIRDTVVAAIASVEATEAVLAGHLTRALSYSGFGEVDLSDAVARTEGGVLLRVIPGLRPRDAEVQFDADGEAESEAAPQPDPSSDVEPGAEAEPEADAGPAAGFEPGAEAEPEVDMEQVRRAERDGAERDPEQVEREIAAAGAAYAEAAAAVGTAKAAVAAASSRLDAVKQRVGDLTAQLQDAEADLATAYEQDAAARAGVAEAVKARQAAAARLAAAEAD